VSLTVSRQVYFRRKGDAMRISTFIKRGNKFSSPATGKKKPKSISRLQPYDAEGK